MWGQKSYLILPEITNFCSWFYPRMEVARYVKDFIFLFLVLIKRVRKWGEFTIFFRYHKSGNIFLRSSASCEKI